MVRDALIQKYMKLKLDPKNPRRVLDEDGNEIFIFTGFYLDDLRRILRRMNGESTQL